MDGGSDQVKILSVIKINGSWNGSNFERRESWHSYMLVHRPGVTYVIYVVLPVLYILGIIGNVLSALVWFRANMRSNNSSAIYLGVLAITDLLYLALSLTENAQYQWDIVDFYPATCQCFYTMYHFGQYMSPLLVLAFTVERWIAVCKPFHKQRYCTVSSALRVISSLVVFALLLSGMQAYFYRLDEVKYRCMIRPEVLQQVGDQASLWSVWTWVIELLLFGTIPLAILTFNILVLIELRKILHRSRSAYSCGQSDEDLLSSRTTTVMLLCVSFYVIFTTLPATLVFTLGDYFPEGNRFMTDDAITRDPTWQQFLNYMSAKYITTNLYLSNFALNFFIYLITGAQFRKALCVMFHCKVFRQRKASTE